ncbi:MAG: helix-turn-helix transcriptional regulator [Desulfobacterales bacterium]|nr:helix-turn-helix transcriptional regulator [Desulfobacterales bacterium]MDD4071296.1 helix-turn-helix transcriptional regulator [Desulfobacterales bacterium]MDD4393311.1 helix-turn-helix transcriptional regulator [Desulfobacterales bacterium]
MKKARSYKSILGKKIRVLRELRGWSQLKLALELNYSSSGSISLIESGERGMDQERIAEAARLLGVHPAKLLSPNDISKEEIEMFAYLQQAIENKAATLPAIKILLKEAAERK